ARRRRGMGVSMTARHSRMSRASVSGHSGGGPPLSYFLSGGRPVSSSVRLQILSFPARGPSFPHFLPRSPRALRAAQQFAVNVGYLLQVLAHTVIAFNAASHLLELIGGHRGARRSEEHTSELQSRGQLVCRLLPAKKKDTTL